MARQPRHVPNEWFLEASVDNALREAENAGHLTPGARQAVAAIVVRHVGTQPWNRPARPGGAALWFGRVVSVLICTALLLGAVWLVQTIARAVIR